MDDDERWLAAEVQQAGLCPACDGSEARPIVYGMPISDFYQRMSGRVEFYGCCLPEVLHRWTCGGCGHEWGRRSARGEAADVGIT